MNQLGNIPERAPQGKNKTKKMPKIKPIAEINIREDVLKSNNCCNQQLTKYKNKKGHSRSKKGLETGDYRPGTEDCGLRMS